MEFMRSRDEGKKQEAAGARTIPREYEKAIVERKTQHAIGQDTLAEEN